MPFPNHINRIGICVPSINLSFSSISQNPGERIQVPGQAGETERGAEECPVPVINLFVGAWCLLGGGEISIVQICSATDSV